MIVLNWRWSPQAMFDSPSTPEERRNIMLRWNIKLQVKMKSWRKCSNLGTSNFASLKHPIQNGVKTWIIPGVESTLLVLFSFQQFWSIILRASFMARVEEILEGKVRTFVISATPRPPTPNTHTSTHLSCDYLHFFQKNLTTEEPWRMGAGRDGLDWVQKGKGKRCQTTTKNRKSCADDTDICFLIWRLPGTKAMICGIIFNILLASSIQLIC